MKVHRLSGLMSEHQQSSVYFRQGIMCLGCLQGKEDSAYKRKMNAFRNIGTRDTQFPSIENAGILGGFTLVLSKLGSHRKCNRSPQLELRKL